MDAQRGRSWLADRIKAVRIRTLVFWSTLLFLEASIVLLYLFVSNDRILILRYSVLYPMLWINVAIAVFMYATPSEVPRGRKVLAFGVGIGYFLLLLIIPGRIALTGAFDGVIETQLRWLIPGWGPVLSLDGGVFQATFVPYETIGYAALAYLVSLNVRRFSRGSFAGLLGVVTCVGCTVPVIVPLLGVLGGTGSALATVATSWFYDIGTMVFLIAIALLYRGT